MARYVWTHHRHLPRCPPGWLFCYGWLTDRWWDPGLHGLVIVGRPVSRVVAARGDTAEVSRCCIGADHHSPPEEAPHCLASRLLGAAAREARRLGYARLQTYTLACESGVSLRAAGFKEDGVTRGGEWGRGRPAAQPGPKRRWVRAL